MKKDTSAKYLGGVITCKGRVRETIEKRTNRGWGKIAEIMGIEINLVGVKIHRSKKKLHLCLKKNGYERS